MPRLRRIAALTLLLAPALIGCGSDSPSPVVVRVGTVAIDSATVDHWARAIALGSAVESVPEGSSSTPRQKALEFLISANWAIGEAAERGLGVSDAAVSRGLKEKINGAPSRGHEFEEEIASTGQTLADVRLEVKAALALVALRAQVARSIAPVTQAQVAGYYRRHRQSFRVPDKRLVDLIEEIHGYAHAVALGRELGAGERFKRRGMRELVAHETPEEAAHRPDGQMVQAIFATPPGRVGGPVIYDGRWVLLVVRKLVPGSLEPLGEVKAEIAERLAEQRHGRALASFLAAYRRQWTAKTSCRAGFVVQKCSEYRGSNIPEGDLLARG